MAGSTLRSTGSHFDRLVAVNLKGVFLCMKHEIRHMLKLGGGAIVNIASTNSFRPQLRQTPYTATKHAVIGLTRNAAVEYGNMGIRINATCPGRSTRRCCRNRLPPTSSTWHRS